MPAGQPPKDAVITLTPSRQWIMLEALAFLTSAEGQAHLLTKYPNMQWEILGTEINQMINEFLEAEPPKKG